MIDLTQGPASSPGFNSAPDVAHPELPDLSGLGDSGGPAAKAAGPDQGNPLDQLGRALFDQNTGLFNAGDNNPLFKGIGAVGRSLGEIGHNVAGASISLGGTALSAIPTILSHTPNPENILPGNLDDQFRAVGKAFEPGSPTANPEEYALWQKADMNAKSDFLFGANYRSDYMLDFRQRAADATKEGPQGLLGNTGTIGTTAGSIGGALADLINAYQIPAAAVQHLLGQQKLFGQDTAKKGAAFSPLETALGLNGTGQTRLEEIQQRAKMGMPLNDVEKTVVNNLANGAWTQDHAMSYLVRMNQGISRDFDTQMVGSILTDPMTYLTLGGGAALKLGEAGAQASDILSRADRLANEIETAKNVGDVVGATDKAAELAQLRSVPFTTTQKLGMLINDAKSIPGVSMASHVAWGIIDPFSLATKAMAGRQAVSLLGKAAVGALKRATGAGAWNSAWKRASKLGFGDVFARNVQQVAGNGARSYVVDAKRASMMNAGLGERLNDVMAPDVADELVRTAGQDQVDGLTDHFFRSRQVITDAGKVTPEEAARLEQGWVDALSAFDEHRPSINPETGKVISAQTYGQAQQFILKSLRAARAARETAGLSADQLQVADRLVTQHGVPLADARAAVAEMGHDELGLFHNTTFAEAENQLAKRVAEIDPTAAKTNLENLTVLNPRNLNNVKAQVLAAAIDAAPDEISKARVWNDAVAEMGLAGSGGRVDANIFDIQKRIEWLQRQIEGGGLHTMLTEDELSHPAMAPVREWLGANTIDGRRVWEVGYRPDPIHAWSLERDPATDLYRVNGPVNLPHVLDASPAARPAGEVLRNVLGQKIGMSKAAAIAKPVDLMDSILSTLGDQVSGARRLDSMQQKFIRNMAQPKYGVAKDDARKIFSKVMDEMQARHSSLDAMQPSEMWPALKGMLPVGSKATIHDLTTELLNAAGGDMRILGVTNALTQRARAALEAAGLGHNNMLGQLTVTGYRLFRYSVNPIFQIQRATDAGYFSILKGVPLQSWRDFKPGSELQRWQAILARVGETASARDFAMDLPEWRFQSTFRDSILQKAKQRNLAEATGKIGAVSSRIQRNQMVAMTYHDAGQMVRDGLESARSELLRQAADTSLNDAERAQAAAAAKNTFFGDLRAHYSAQAGRVLDDNEVALRYMEAMFSESLPLGQRLTEDGLKYEPWVNGLWHSPSSVGAINPDLGLAQAAEQLGFESESALRSALLDTGPNGKTSTWFRSAAEQELQAHPDWTNRALEALRYDGDKEWANIGQSLDLNRAQTEQLRTIVAQEAQLHGMKPNEFVTQVLKTNLGTDGLSTHIQQVVDLIRAASSGTQDEQIAKLADVFWGQLQPSGMDVMMNKGLEQMGNAIESAQQAGRVEEAAALSAQRDALMGRPTVGYARFGTDARGNATVPAQFRSEPGYVYRTVGDHRVGYDWRPGEYAASHPATIYVKGPHYAIVRTPMDESAFESATGGVNASHNLRTTGMIPSSKVEVLASDGTWRPVEAPSGERVGREVTPEEMAQLRSRGQFLTEQRTRPSVVEKGVDLQAAMNEPAREGGGTIADEIYRKTMGKEYGGATFSPRIGKYIHESPGIKAPEAGGDGPFVSAIGQTMSVPIDEAKDPAAFKSALGQFVAENDALLRQQGNYVGTFYDVAKGTVDFDVSSAAFTRADAEALQLTRGPEAQGAFSIATANEPVQENIFPPHLPPVSSPTAAVGQAHLVDQVKRAMLGDAAALADPNVAAIARAFSKWGRDAVASQLRDSRGWVGKLTTAISSSIPTDNAFMYNRSEGLIQQVMQQGLDRSAKDAFRLAEMATTRSVLDRSLNHPLFGLYPSSYMWGKVFPQMVRFIARDPFGFESSIGALLTAKVMAAMAIQRETDPNFSTAEGALDHNPVAYALSYLTPSLPMDEMKATTNPAFQSLAEKGFNANSMLQAALKMMAPLRSAPQYFKAAGSVGNALKAPMSLSGLPFEQAVQPTPAPAGLSPDQASGLTSISQQGSGNAPAAPAIDYHQPIQGTGLAPVLSDQLQSLENALK